MGQVFQAKEGLRTLTDDHSDYQVVGVLPQPSLSLAETSHATFRTACAFLLQAFPVSGIMVGTVSDSFLRAKAGRACQGEGHRQGAQAPIHARDFGEMFAEWFGKINP
jgi:hypothetical protein